MPFVITLGLVETLLDLVVNRVKIEQAGETTIRSRQIVTELIVFYGVGSSGGAGAGQYQGATSGRG